MPTTAAKVTASAAAADEPAPALDSGERGPPGTNPVPENIAGDAASTNVLLQALQQMLTISEQNRQQDMQRKQHILTSSEQRSHQDMQRMLKVLISTQEKVQALTETQTSMSGEIHGLKNSIKGMQNTVDFLRDSALINNS